MLHPSNPPISKLTGMFLDKPLELQFQVSYLTRSKKSLRNTALIMGIFFFSFLIYDFSANKSFPLLFVLFLCRLTVLVLSLLIYFKTDHFLKSFAFLRITLYELIIVVFFFIIAFSYENPHFLIQALALNVAVLVIFMVVPNSLPYKVFVSSFSLISFLTLALIRYHPSFLETISVFVYLQLTIIFGSISTYSLGKYKRLDFANKQYFIELSKIDPLTNIYNRQKFNESLRNEIDLARRYKNTFSLIMFDIDHFKAINDKNGHIFGDKVLINIANLIKESIREVDVFARWGGEEFIILLPQTDCSKASSLAERLRYLVYKEHLKNNLNLTCSFGVTSFSIGDDEDLIMNRVDMALYKAKNDGRNMVITAV